MTYMSMALDTLTHKHGSGNWSFGRLLSFPNQLPTSMSGRSGSDASDDMGRDLERVVNSRHRLQCSRLADFGVRFVEDVKDNDSFCISLSLSFAEDQTGMLLGRRVKGPRGRCAGLHQHCYVRPPAAGIFQHMEAAIAYLQSFQMWVDGKDAEDIQRYKGVASIDWPILKYHDHS